MARPAISFDLLLAVTLILTAAVWPCESRATDEDPAFVLAVTCWGETAASSLDECTAIGEVLAFRSVTGTVTPSITRAYSAVWKGSASGRPWLFGLNLAGDEPAGWRSHLDWPGVWRARWLALLSHTRLIVAGEVPPVCAETPHHFGARSGVDAVNAERGRWAPVDCGPRMRNRFYRVR
jgi:hypothetical protein